MTMYVNRSYEECVLTVINMQLNLWNTLSNGKQTVGSCVKGDFKVIVLFVT